MGAKDRFQRIGETFYYVKRSIKMLALPKLALRQFNEGRIVGAVQLHFMKHLQSTEDYAAMSRLQEGAFKLVVQPGQTETLKGLP